MSASPAEITAGLHASRTGAVLRLALNRPRAANALTYPLMIALRNAFTVAGTDPDVRAIVIAGAGDDFCAGDERDVADWPAEFAGRRPEGSHGAPPLPEQAMLTAVRACPKPTIARLHGRVHGLGFDLAAVCDHRLSSADASFADARIDQARHVATGVTHVLPRLIGLSQAMRLLLLGEAIDAAEARRIGFVHEVHPDLEALDAAVDALAGRLAIAPTRSYAVIKQQVIDELDMPYDTALMHSMAIRQTNMIEDRTEGRSAFLEKRAPNFTGR